MSLPEEYSHDIPRESLPGKATKVLLQKGDMLYLPRGTIHEALSQSQFSTHVTISVYQHYNMKKLLIHLVPRLLDSAFHKNIDLREGLPIWMSDKFGSYVGLQESYFSQNQNNNEQNESNDDSRSIEIQTKKKTVLQHSETRKRMVETLKSLVQSLVDEISIELLDETADEITGDFVMHRLPPPSADNNNNNNNNYDNKRIHDHIEFNNHDVDDHIKSSNDNTSSSLTINSKYDKNKRSNDSRRHTDACTLHPNTLISICDPRSMFCMVKEEDGVSMLALSHNKYNDRAAHMGHPSPDLGYDSESESESDGRHLRNNENGNEDEDDGEKIDHESSSDRDEDQDEDQEGREEDEGFNWTLFIPLRLAAVIIGLQLACSPDEDIVKSDFSSTSISLHDLHKLMRKKRIFPDEVSMIIFSIYLLLSFQDVFFIVCFILFLFPLFS